MFYSLGMEPEKDVEQPPKDPKELPPLTKGRPLSREESVERMYERFDKTFEALAQ